MFYSSMHALNVLSSKGYNTLKKLEFQQQTSGYIQYSRVDTNHRDNISPLTANNIDISARPTESQTRMLADVGTKGPMESLAITSEKGVTSPAMRYHLVDARDSTTGKWLHGHVQKVRDGRAFVRLTATRKKRATQWIALDSERLAPLGE